MSYRDQEFPQVEQELVDEVLPLLRKSVQHKLDAEKTDRQLMELLGCYKDVTPLVEVLASSVQSVDQITEDNVAIFVDQVNYLASETEDEDEDEDDEEDEEEDEVFCDACGRSQDEHDEGNINHGCTFPKTDLCVLCDEKFSPDLESWDDLDPECADRVSGYMDEHKVTRETAIESLRKIDDPDKK